MDVTTCSESPQLARARSVLAARIGHRITVAPDDVETVAVEEALAIANGVTPPLPPIAPLPDEAPPTLQEVRAALAAALEVASSPAEAARLAQACRTLATPVAW